MPPNGLRKLLAAQVIALLLVFVVEMYPYLSRQFGWRFDATWASLGVVATSVGSFAKSQIVILNEKLGTPTLGLDDFRVSDNTFAIHVAFGLVFGPGLIAVLLVVSDLQSLRSVLGVTLQGVALMAAAHGLLHCCCTQSPAILQKAWDVENLSDLGLLHCALFTVASVFGVLCWHRIMGRDLLPQSWNAAIANKVDRLLSLVGLGGGRLTGLLAGEGEVGNSRGPGYFCHGNSSGGSDYSSMRRIRTRRRGGDGGQATCIICMTAPSEATFVHRATGHTCACMACAQTLLRRNAPCPMCRETIESVIHNYS